MLSKINLVQVWCFTIADRVDNDDTLGMKIVVSMTAKSNKPLRQIRRVNGKLS